MKIAGALYLAYLGVQSLRHSRATAPMPGPGRAGLARDRSTAGRALLQGFLNNVLNPKVALFYLTFLPQFIQPGDNVLVRSLVLASIHVALGLAWLFTYAYAIERLALVMQGARRWLERISGVALLGLSVRLAFERR